MKTVSELKELLAAGDLADDAPVLLYTSERGGPMAFKQTLEADFDYFNYFEVVQVGYDEDREVPLYEIWEEADHAEMSSPLIKALVIMID